LFDEPVTKGATGQIGRHLPFNGVPAIYNFTGMLRDRGYCWFASVLHPASLATCAAHLSPDEHVALMSRFHYTSSLTITMRDNPDRSRILMRGGRPQLDYLESASDCERLRRCFIDASRALLAVGARRVFLPMLQPPRIESESDLNAIERIEMSYDRVLLYSDHMSGGNAFGGDARLGVTDENGRVFGSENVYIADSSLFPSPSGVGPSWTIMALSRLVASRLAAARSGSCRARNSDGHSSVSPSRGDRRTVTIGQVCSALIRHPLRSVVYRWHWKNAIASALLRSTLFFLTNLAAGHDAAIRATLVEFALRIPLVGVLAAVTQSFSYVYPVWAATFFAVAGLPTLALVTECVVHWLVRTPELATSMQASIALSAFSTMFGLFVMRRGVMIVDDVHRPFGDDLKQLPRLVVEFALALPRRLAQAGR
jgi:hypothetical protein